MQLSNNISFRSLKSDVLSERLISAGIEIPEKGTGKDGIIVRKDLIKIANSNRDKVLATFANDSQKNNAVNNDDNVSITTALVKVEQTSALIDAYSDTDKDINKIDANAMIDAAKSANKVKTDADIDIATVNADTTIDAAKSRAHDECRVELLAALSELSISETKSKRTVTVESAKVSLYCMSAMSLAWRASKSPMSSDQLSDDVREQMMHVEITWLERTVGDDGVWRTGQKTGQPKTSYLPLDYQAIKSQCLLAIKADIPLIDKDGKCKGRRALREERGKQDQTNAQKQLVVEAQDLNTTPNMLLIDGIIEDTIKALINKINKLSPTVAERKHAKEYLRGRAIELSVLPSAKEKKEEKKKEEKVPKTNEIDNPESQSTIS